MNCISDISVKDFTDVSFCAAEYSVGTNTELEIYIKVTEIESGRVLRKLVSNEDNRFLLASAWFTPFNTYLIECFDTDSERIQWTFEDAEFDAYRVKFKMINGNCGGSELITEIG